VSKRLLEHIYSQPLLPSFEVFYLDDVKWKPPFALFSAFRKAIVESHFFIFQTETFTAVYKKLTGKEVAFEFPEPYL
jgi:hypothetical protein